MTLSTSEAVRETYRLALQQEITRRLRTQPDWDRFLTIAKDRQDREAAEINGLRAEYMQRFAEAREVVLRERTGLHYDQPKPPGAPDPLDKDNIDAVAKERVDYDHARRLTAIKEDEIDGYRELRADLISRSQQQGHARDRFNQASRTQTRSQQY